MRGATVPTTSASAKSAAPLPARTTWYFHPDNNGGLLFEQETGETGTVTNRHDIAGGAGVFAVFVSTGAGSASIARRDYWHVDHLGSIVAVSDQTGPVTQRFAYDPFGKRRFTNGAFDASNELFIDWTRFANRNSSGTLFTTLLGSQRGFTGHEHLDDLGLIHMNGRIFDPLIGRFLQADPFVQFPDALAAYLAGPVNGVNDMVRETAVQAGIGGTLSKLTGGSFSNGATNAAYQYLFNYLSEEMIAQWGAESQREAGWSAASWVSTSDRALMEAGFDLLDPTRGGMRALRMSATASKWGKQHGGNDHWKILTKIADGPEAKGWQNIRINRRQVDSQGTVVGRNRPDISATSPRGIRYNIEVDTLRPSAVRHHSRLVANDPNSRVRLVPVR